MVIALILMGIYLNTHNDHANNGRLYSDAGQIFMIFNDVYGRERTYPIPLNQIQE